MENFSIIPDFSNELA